MPGGQPPGGPAGQSAAGNDSWVGKIIITKKDGIKVSNTAADGKPACLGELKSVNLTVLADQGGRLKVIWNGVEGWFDKTDAVLLENAVAFFTDQIRKNASDSRLTALGARPGPFRAIWTRAFRISITQFV
jgi:hypothetical protein